MGIARTVANGCNRERNVERTHPQPPDPQSETGTLATHSGKTNPTIAEGRNLVTDEKWKWMIKLYIQNPGKFQF